MHCRTVIERMFGRIKDWRRVATRYDRSPTVFLSAIILAATVIFWLCVLSLGEAFGIPLLAEGVKTKDELNFLTAEVCDFVQGFHFGKPISLSATRTLVMDQDMDAASGSPFERRNCA
jgi:predicted signal transduction protein with EAL and GGDEF domain